MQDIKNLYNNSLTTIPEYFQRKGVFYMKDSHLWWRDGVIYQIYPRSFMDSNRMDLATWRDYNGWITWQTWVLRPIWLSPIYPSPDADHGYDISDYQAIDPRFGSLEAFGPPASRGAWAGDQDVMDMVMKPHFPTSIPGLPLRAAAAIILSMTGICGRIRGQVENCPITGSLFLAGRAGNSSRRLASSISTCFQSTNPT